MAASGTLKTTPVNDNYNNAANWVSGNLPTSSGDTATFNNVQADGVNNSLIYFTKFTANTTVGTFNFNAPITQHIILLDGGFNLTFSGGNGVLVNTTVTGTPLPAFNVADLSTLTFNTGNASNVTGPGRVSYNVSGDIVFNNSATLGNANLQIGAGTGDATFNNTSSAGTALILNNGDLEFNDTSTAGSAFITNNDDLEFREGSSAGSSTITNNSSLHFHNTSTAASSVVTLQSGGHADFFDTAEGGTARFILNGQVLSHVEPCQEPSPQRLSRGN